jgi:DNA repair protein RadC
MKKNKKTITYASLPFDELPREKLKDRGVTSLSDKELLAILLNTGIKGKNVKELAGDMLKLLDDSKDIPSVREISGLTGIGQFKACAVAAMLCETVFLPANFNNRWKK